MPFDRVTAAGQALTRQTLAARAGDPLARYRRYTTLTFGFLGPFFALTAALYAENVLSMVLCLVAGVPLTAIMLFWERRPPLWLTAVAIVTSMAAWVSAIFMVEAPYSVVLASMTIALPLSHITAHRLLWNIAGLALLVSPVFIAAMMQDESPRWNYLVSATFGFAISWVVFRTNTYAWRLYLDLDEARAAEAELAVVRERFRMASDIHDIQGHTLHVIKLKLQLADRLVDENPAEAHQHLAEARELVTETLANTRSLVYGERTVTLAGELANAQQLLGAADITVTVTGSVSVVVDAASTASANELWGLLVRETTTNILRHADASAVHIVLDGGTVSINNDGARGGPARLSGLARLGRRFEEAGGALSTSSDRGNFQTKGTVS